MIPATRSPGPIAFEYSVFAVDGRPDLNMVVYNPATPADAERISSLIGASPSVSQGSWVARRPAGMEYPEWGRADFTFFASDGIQLRSIGDEIC